ncbi:hypothetical protein RhiJN_22294 [Ceratobasidium sp. AG-Ba]|nr:hypothetical protein RhiJN_22294 [Ceratobasidium sp. AG-Ba]
MTRITLFGPSTTEVPTSESLESAHYNVTIPQSAKLVQPTTQLLEQLLPVRRNPVVVPIDIIFERIFAPNGVAGISAPVDFPGVPYANALRNSQNRARTENGAEAYRSTGSAVLDAFSGLNANSSTPDIHRQLAASWAESPELTLRIIWNMRSIHEGHNSKYGFYHAFGWLYKNHPRTAVENLTSVVEPLCQRPVKRPRKKTNNAGAEEDFEVVDTPDLPDEIDVMMSHGYYKDLLNILVLAMRNELGNPTICGFEPLNVPRSKAESRKKSEWKEIKEKKRVDLARAVEAKKARTIRREGDFNALEAKLKSDKSFLALYATVAQIFADALANDVALLKKIEAASEEEAFDLQFELTSASKWAPTIEGFHDRMTNISTAIALTLYARGHMADLPLVISSQLTQDEAHILRSYYRRWIISPLRRFIEVTEVKMSAQKWDEINYPRVSAECMKTNKSHFFRHDEKRFENYISDVEAGHLRINSAALLPHELLIEAIKMKKITTQKPRPKGKKLKPKAAMEAEILRRLEESNRKVIEAQWNSIVDRMRDSGSLHNSLAVVDVSGSMGSIHSPPDKTDSSVEPIFPAIALGILLAQLAQPPFNNMFITFSSAPELLTLRPGGLIEKAAWMVTTEWSMNTNYEAVFLKLLLPVAIEHKVKPKDMVKRLFVFSDMQFDQSLIRRSNGGWETSHDRIVKAYEQAGYEAPEIVYWNLQGNTTKPVLQDTPGTSLLTGFSANMMKLFMEGENVDNEVSTRKPRDNPITVMKRALSKSCYNTLVVYD